MQLCQRVRGQRTTHLVLGELSGDSPWVYSHCSPSPHHGPVAQSVVAAPLQGDGRGFDSRWVHASLHGGCSSIGRAPGCGPGGSEIETRQSPQRGTHVDGPVSHKDGGAGSTPVAATVITRPLVWIRLRVSTPAVPGSSPGGGTRVWRNGRRAGLRGQCSQGREGSTPSTRT